MAKLLNSYRNWA